MPAILQCDITFLTCLGYLGCSDINRNNPICVASPKVDMASTMVVAIVGVFACDIALNIANVNTA